MSDTLFEVDDYEPIKVKHIRCAACAGYGQTLRGETCPRCDGAGRLGTSFWRGKEWLHDVRSAVAA